jgi:single stranded DNA-binding protein
MVNRIILVGKLGKDTSPQTSKTNKKYTYLSVATSSGYNNGIDWVEETHWHSVVAFWEINAFKGETVYIEGELTYSTHNEIKKASVRAKTVKIISGKRDTDKVAQNANVEPTDGITEFEGDLPF